MENHLCNFFTGCIQLKTLRATAFILGLLLTLVSVSFLGDKSLQNPQFPGLKRFWMYQSPSTNFFPTARQLEAWSTQQISSTRQTVVIIGGGSVLMGVGQPVELSVSEQLQNILGGEYRVLNLASRGGATYGQGQYVATSLVKKGYNVKFIADVFINYVPPFQNNSPYEKTYWQSKYAGMLSPLGDVDKAIKVKIFSLDRILGFLNEKLRYEELANYISYNFLPLTQSLAIGDQSLRSLKTYPDIEPNTPYEKRYLNPDWEKSQLEMVKSNASNNYPDQDLKETALTAKIGFGRKNSPATLLVACKYNPRYVSQLTEEIKSNYFNNINRQLVFYNFYGLQARNTCDDFSDRDYSDGTHLSVEGAQKLAKVLSEWIKESE